MKHEVKTFKMRSWSGICLLQYLLSLSYGSKNTSNNEKWTMPGTPKSYENTFMMTKENLCVVVLSIIPLHKTSDLLFFKWRFFLFKELLKIFKDFGGNFKDFSRISNNFSIQGLFKDMTLIQGLFRACVNHVSVNIKNNAEQDMPFFSLKDQVLPNETLSCI